MPIQLIAIIPIALVLIVALIYYNQSTTRKNIRARLKGKSLILSSSASCTTNSLPPAQVLSSVPPIMAKASTAVLLAIPPRRMWGWGDESGSTQVGYCGETAYQSIALYWGNWVSLEIINKATGVKKNPTLLLCDTSESTAANALKLVSTQDCGKSYASFSEFATEVATNIDKGFPCLFGVYDWIAGDTDNVFDHIVSAVGYGKDSSGNITEVYYNDAYLLTTSVLTVSDYGKRNQKTADMCNRYNYEEYFPPYIFCIPSGSPNRAFSVVSGNCDINGELYRCHLSVNQAWEPDWGYEDKIIAPSGAQLNATAAIFGLTPNTTYALCRFDDYTSLPTNGFLAACPASNVYKFTASDSQVSLTSKDTSLLSFNSKPSNTTSGGAFFRVVKA